MESNLIPSSTQNSTTNSQSIKGINDSPWENVYEEKYANWKKALMSLYCKKVVKGGGNS